MMRHLITGGAGFIGVNLARRLLAAGETVIAVDDLSRGSRDNMAEISSQAGFSFIQVDCSDPAAMESACAGAGAIGDVWHLAANSDIPAGIADPGIDLHQTFLTTVGTLNFMRHRGIERLHFASSSAVYGDFGKVEIHEDIGPLEPISNYGAMKLASEALIRASVEAFLTRADIFRFPNVIGVPATHGVIWDFVRKLARTPDRLEVLGDGSQQKSYLHVNDLVDAMLHISHLDGRYLVFNIGPADDGITVRDIAETVRTIAMPSASIAFGKGDRGWVGDVPRFSYSTRRLAATGWMPRLGSRDAVRKAVDEIIAQELSN